MNTITETDEISLYYRKGASDKMYQVRIEPKDAGFVVRFAFGRRGTALNTGTKTPVPVDYAEAREVFEKLVRAKLAKGYSPGGEGIPFRHTGLEGRDTGIACQLLHPVSVEEEVAELLQDAEFCLQEKFDGKRLLVRKAGNVIEGINRKGLAVALPESLSRAVGETIDADCLLDGESLGESLVVFDLLEADGRDLRSRPYIDRLTALDGLIESAVAGDIVQIAPTAIGGSAKTALLRKLRETNAEGGVFKRLDAPFIPGRDGHRDQFKHKFHETASFVAGSSNPGRRSIALSLLDEDGRLVPAGNVTIPPNHPVPQPGTVVDVRYLYAFRESGSVYQPVYLGERDDVEPAECSTGQLKFKAETSACVSA